MPKPYSQDLRERVVRAVEAGASCREAAAAFEVSASSAIRWVARWRLTRSAAAKPMGGKRSPLDAHKPWLLELIAAEPDLTLEEIRGRLRQRGIKVSASSVWRFCDRHGITFKKKPARSRTRPRGRSHSAHELEARAAAA
jgi:transposase